MWDLVLIAFIIIIIIWLLLIELKICPLFCCLYTTINLLSCLGIPTAESFSFALNSLLNDAATYNPQFADKIFDAQVSAAILCNSEQLYKITVC